jgi:hypothetical protein
VHEVVEYSSEVECLRLPHRPEKVEAKIKHQSYDPFIQLFSESSLNVLYQSRLIKIDEKDYLILDTFSKSVLQCSSWIPMRRGNMQSRSAFITFIRSFDVIHPL